MIKEILIVVAIAAALYVYANAAGHSFGRGMAKGAVNQLIVERSGK